MKLGSKLKNYKTFYIIIFIIIINLFLCTNVLAVEDPPDINSKSAILMENESGNILFEKKSTKKMYPASTTKIMTAILAIENCDLSDTVVVSESAINAVPEGYTTAQFVAGESVTVENLLYGLMLSSGNEAANVLAEYISGSIENFSELMNQKAKILGCENTHFVNANGMHDENHYTTAKDLAIITRYCMKNETFRKIVATEQYTLPATDIYSSTDRVLENTNSLIKLNSPYYYKYAIGVKTGYTTQAGNCLVSYSNKNEVELICVTLNADSNENGSSYRYDDTKSLLEYGYNNFSQKAIVNLNTVISHVQISNATKETRELDIVTQKSIFDFVPNDITIDESNAKVQIKEDLKAPINAGDVLGKITYNVNGETYSTDLIANSNVYIQHNYSILFLIIGLALLIASIIIIPKKSKNRRY